MDLLYHVHRGSLYTDTTILADVGYKRLSDSKAVFFFSEEPNFDFPFLVSFQPVGEPYDNISFSYKLTGYVVDKDELGDVCYKVSGTAEGIPEDRNDVRVIISIPVEIQLRNKRTIDGIVTDISAGGFMFISKEKLSLESDVEFALPLDGKTPYIAGIIKHLRPTRVKDYFGYGCQYNALLPKTEAVIRSFVFREEVKERKRKVTF